MSKPFRRIIRLSLYSAAALILLIAGVNTWMTARARGRIHTDAAAVPQEQVALVLGTGKFFGDRINIHWRARMDAAAALFKAGRVSHLLLSGDNSTKSYNEPEDMKQALIERGVPAADITCDYAGFRTLDSIVRAREVFDVTRCVIISDDFHLARALWLADCHGIIATAYHGDPVTWKSSGKSRVREWLARVKAVADEITGTDPKFGGPKVPLGSRPVAAAPPVEPSPP